MKKNDLEKLFKLAVKMRRNSHSPYSGFSVGAAIETNQGEMFGGCNVENASYGGTVCAERTAILKAVSEVGKIKIKRVLVVTDDSNPWPPCGFCRQTISEFAMANTEIHLANLKGIKKSYSFKEIFPEAFGQSNLKKKLG